MTTDLGDQAMSSTATAGFKAATADAVFALIGAGLNDFDRNWESARASLARAYAMLQAERAAPADAAIAQGGLAPWQVKKIEAFVAARLDTAIAIADLAAQVRLSPQHFSRAFRQSFGASPHAWVVGRRVARARHLMLTTTDPLCRIALDCGFSDQAHFTRRFHTEMGLPPNTWRRQALGPAGR